MSRPVHDPARRQVIRSLVGGSMLMPGIVAQLLADESGGDAAAPLAPRSPHSPARAKRVIFLYMSGGVSHMDSFDPKPRLIADAGKPMSNRPGARPVLAPLWEFR